MMDSVFTHSVVIALTVMASVDAAVAFADEDTPASLTSGCKTLYFGLSHGTPVEAVQTAASPAGANTFSDFDHVDNTRDRLWKI